MSLIIFFLITTFLALVLLKRKSSFYVFLLIFPVFLVLNLIVYEYSISIGKEGYSVFTKNILADEVIYYGEAVELFNAVHNGEFFTLISKNSIFYNHFYSLLLLIVFLFFNSTQILIARAVTAVFFALFFVQANRFVQLVSGRSNMYPLVFLLLCYPTLTIRGLQIEQEMFVNFIMLSIINQIINSNTKINYLLTLFFFKILAFIPLLSAFINNKIKLNFLLQLIFIPVVIIMILKYVYPSSFNYVVAVKSYVIMDGKPDVFPINYDSAFGIVKTIFYSTYYFLFAPLNISTIINGSTTFKILLVEPLALIISLFYVFKNKKIIHFSKKLYIIFSFLFYYMLSYIMVESHITSLMRRRVIVYAIIFLLVLVVFRKKNKFVLPFQKLENKGSQ